MLKHHNHPGYAALRRGRYSEPGRAYLLTTIVRDRHRLFSEPQAAALVARSIIAPGAFLDAKPLAWVLMPDHWHGLIELGQADLSRVLQRFKASTARALLDTGLAGAPVWAKGFHDHALRADEELRHAARYIIMNPVRAGLVHRIGDYPYWNAIWL